MCGIIGISSQTSVQDPDLVIAMRDRLRHRGPDDFGLWMSADGKTILGHRRLAIIDLSPAGHQPMHDVRRRLTIVFNGEIYNFRDLRDELISYGHGFMTQSDTEVILQAYNQWGERCVEKLNGMFAFALYDADRDIIFASRDRSGEKPFYYWRNGNSFIFASELKALLQHPEFICRLDLEAMNFYLAYGYVPHDKCIYQGVRKLPQGHSLVFERPINRMTVRQYWSLPEPTNCDKFDTREVVGEFRSLLTDAVGRQLIADVPVGILLSGGIDSSLITAIASYVSDKPVKTYTVSFPGHPAFNEDSYAKIVSNYFGTDHTVLSADTISVDLLSELACQYDEPLADSSMIPTFLVSRLIRQYATVAIGGDGGDELFGGYLHYPWLENQALARRYLPASMRRVISQCAKDCMPIGLRGRSYLLGLEGEVQNSFAFVNQFFDHDARQKIFPPFRSISSHVISNAERFKAEMDLPGKTIVQRATAADFMTYLVDDILVKVDRASMLTSLEVRAPFLDFRIVEFAFSKVHDSLRVHGAARKVLPRLLARDMLPRELDLKRKQGFSIPLAKWFKGEWGEYMKSVLLDADSSFNRGMVLKLIEGQERGYSNAQRLFSLMMFELWRREYGVTW